MTANKKVRQEAKVKPLEALPEDTPEQYVNSSYISAHLYDFLFEFGLTYPDGRTITTLKVRMSPQHAWVMSQILTRTLDTYIEKVGKIELPHEFLEEKNLLDAYNAQLKARSKENV